MPARPLSTFQSEGWTRPHRARAEHYFRPQLALAAESDAPLGSVCGRYLSGHGIRPVLTPTATRTACQVCAQRVWAQLLAPQSESWFAGDPTAEDLLREIVTRIDEARYVNDTDSTSPWRNDSVLDLLAHLRQPYTDANSTGSTAQKGQHA
ncbi:hypothetical protein [Curtobacterium sp. MCBD17_003]|uniref:hypothetical protein n=1 Tax=Curtobacterium sp. MCBD17_003 TaxID=2175667 RepID=UPI0011B6A766|nr:hypothetical protein [Curtobacterium sp. MCBD17_003]WIE54206.1 hypothetical protein DEI88_013940 [Curtobacterium sp. MCBD17_003]